MAAVWAFSTGPGARAAPVHYGGRGRSATALSGSALARLRTAEGLPVLEAPLELATAGLCPPTGFLEAQRRLQTEEERLRAALAPKPAAKKPTRPRGRGPPPARGPVFRTQRALQKLKTRARVEKHRRQLLAYRESLSVGGSASGGVPGGSVLAVGSAEGGVGSAGGDEAEADPATGLSEEL